MHYPGIFTIFFSNTTYILQRCTGSSALPAPSKGEYVERKGDVVMGNVEIGRGVKGP